METRAPSSLLACVACRRHRRLWAGEGGVGDSYLRGHQAALRGARYVVEHPAHPHYWVAVGGPYHRRVPWQARPQRLTVRSQAPENARDRARAQLQLLGFWRARVTRPVASALALTSEGVGRCGADGRSIQNLEGKRQDPRSCALLVSGFCGQPQAVWCRPPVASSRLS
jgi:hypothetical protein